MPMSVSHQYVPQAVDRVQLVVALVVCMAGGLKFGVWKEWWVEKLGVPADGVERRRMEQIRYEAHGSGVQPITRYRRSLPSAEGQLASRLVTSHIC
jgi:hypothetical protein